ncbi:MAG: methionine synthase [Clostridia bacterium]|nr:methionine synthase [Clostridia bacterium]
MLGNVACNIKYLENIPAVPKRDLILSRLGYRKGFTELNANDMALIEECINQGRLICKPAGAYLFTHVTSKSDSGVQLANGIYFQSKSLSKLLEYSNDVVLMAATAGKKVTEKILREVENGSAASGLILDSVASQTADAAIDWIVQFLNKMLAREGRILTRHRFSPGFGDLPLSYQKDIFSALKLDRLNLSLTEKFMLVPEKSVIAIAGVEGKGN